MDNVEGVISLQYFDVLRRIKKKEINPNNFVYEDNNKRPWEWSDEITGFYFEDERVMGGSCEYLTDVYDELDMVDLVLYIIPKNQARKTPEKIAKCEVIEELEELYMNLEMEIDSCQGCMDGLDEAFIKLNIYKDLVKSLGGDIDAHKQELTDKWFQKAREEREVKEQEQAKRDAVITKLPFPMLELVMLPDKKLFNYLMDSNNKINEICEKLIDKLKENE